MIRVIAPPLYLAFVHGLHGTVCVAGPQVRYDGVYRILRCWRKPGVQEHLVCRYLFVRCDNSPAPWTSDGACVAGRYACAASRFFVVRQHDKRGGDW